MISINVITRNVTEKIFTSTIFNLTSVQIQNFSVSYFSKLKERIHNVPYFIIFIRIYLFQYKNVQ